MKGRKVSHTQSHSHWGARAQWNIQPTSINHWWFCCASAKNPASPIPWASCARSWATSSPSLLSRVAGSWVNDPMITATRASKIFNTHWYTHSYRRQSCQSCQACQSCQSCQWSGSFHPKHHTLRGGLAAAARTPSDWKFSFAHRHRHREKGEIKAFKAGRATRCRTKRTRQQQKMRIDQAHLGTALHVWTSLKWLGFTTFTTEAPFNFGRIANCHPLTYH